MVEHQLRSRCDQLWLKKKWFGAGHTGKTSAVAGGGGEIAMTVF